MHRMFFRPVFALLLAAFGLPVAGLNAAPLDFTNDIVPLLSKQGCNSGACHGKAIGQNGFKLSLFGFDPAFDYGALVHEGRGRPGAAVCQEFRELFL